jgi:hypothetical protein
VYILDRARREAIAGQIRQALTGVEGIEAVFTPDQYGRIGQRQRRSGHEDRQQHEVQDFA